jgi:ribosomal protein L37AE/L43A
MKTVPSGKQMSEKQRARPRMTAENFPARYVCPKCGQRNVFLLKPRRIVYQCRGCSFNCSEGEGGSMWTALVGANAGGLGEGKQA